MRYEEIGSLTANIVEAIAADPLNKNRIKSKIAFQSVDRTIHFRDASVDVRPRLTATQKFVSELLVDKFWKRLEDGGSFPLGEKLNLTREGLAAQNGKFIPYSSVSAIRLKDGVAFFFQQDNPKPFMKIKSKEKNFLPCYNLLLLLCHSRMTYVEYCGRQVKPMFGS